MTREELLHLVGSFIDEVGVEEALGELQKVGIGRNQATVTPDRRAMAKKMQADLDRVNPA